MRLGDLDALRKNMEFICMGIMAGTEPYNAPLTEIDNAPTVNDCPKCEYKKEYDYISSSSSYKELQALRKFKRDNERTQGKWINHRTIMHDGEYYCSNCDEVAEWLDGGSQFLSKFCPNCGASMMKGGEKE